MKNGEISDELGGRPPLSGFHIVFQVFASSALIFLLLLPQCAPP
jgi:hypothetical protein